VSPETEGASSPPGGRCWWLKGLAARVALVAALLAAFFLAPVAKLHYHGWRHRTGKDTDGKHLKQAAEMLVARRADQATVWKILGKSKSFFGPNFYITFFGGAAEFGYEIVVQKGRAVAVRPYGRSIE